MASRKIVVVGGVAGGASAAARFRRLDEFARILMFEKGPHCSFSNCSLPFHLSGIVPKAENLVLMSPAAFKTKYNIDVRVNSEVMKINRGPKTVTVKNLFDSSIYDEAYDILVLSPGASPIVPNLPGVDRSNVFTVRNVVDIDRLSQYVRSNGVKDVAVIGGGFIGVEVAENLKLAGYNVSLVEFANQIMTPFDYDMAQMMHKELMDHGIELIVGDGLASIAEDHVQLNSGKRVGAQAVVCAIGVRPETSLARDAALEIGTLGGIKVNANYQTSDPDIYAVGDAIEVHSRMTNKPTRLALAGPALRQARSAADHAYGETHENKGVIGSSSIQIFDLNCASTGLNERMAKQAGIQCDSVYVIAADKVNLMPDCNPLHFKLVFEVPTGRILGAQAIGKGNADKRIDVIATLITMGGTLEDLKELELTYSPMYNTARDITNIAALVGLNVLHGKYKQIHVSEVRPLVEKGAMFIDVRQPEEYAAGHLINSINIPLGEIRSRMNEIPKDVPVYVHCRSGQRSYNATMTLVNSGYKNVVNVSGSFLGISLYEYHDDVKTGRDKIVTAYNFN